MGTPAGQRFARLAAQAAHAPTPLESLRELREVHREIEAFERRQVSRALAEGATFGQIARSLGVSRQAAHRRFRALAVPDPQPLAATADVRRVLDYAREEAAALGCPPGGEHILLASLRAPALPASAVLRNAGATLDAARDLVRTVPATGRLRDALAGAAREARERGGRRIDVAHLLIGALDDTEGGAGRTLRALDVEVEGVRAGLAALLEPVAVNTG
jgi:ATP-dependent Clp protease ATP-binding subunit ClpA